MSYTGLLPGHDYMYDLDWIVRTIKRHTQELSQIDQKIKDAVEIELSDERIQSIVENIISNLSGVVNVKTPPGGLTPAVGDGTQDDTAAIQAAINYVHEGLGRGIIFFPPGQYLTSDLTLYDNIGIIGQGRYSTILYGALGSKAYVLGGEASGVSIANIGIDGNAGNQVNHVDGIDLTGEDYLISNMLIQNCYNGMTITLTDEHFQADNLIMSGFAMGGISIAGGTHAQFSQVQIADVSSTTGDFIMDVATNYCSMRDIWLNSMVPIGLQLKGNVCIFEGTIEGATTPYTNTGNNNTVTLWGTSKDVVYDSHENITIGGGYNLSVGQYELTVADNSTENINGSKSVTATNVQTTATNTIKDTAISLIENINQLKETTARTVTTTGGTINTTATGSINTSADSITETVENSKTENARNKAVTVIGDDSVVAQTIHRKATEGVTFQDKNFTHITEVNQQYQAKDIQLYPQNPLTYNRTPVNNDYYATIPFKTPGNVAYNVLVENEGTKRLAKDYISVIDCGADPTGENDSLAAFNLALARAANSSGIIYIPPGDYALSNTWNIGNGNTTTESNVNDITIFGCGTGASTSLTTASKNGRSRLFRMGTNSTPMITINGPVRNINISNIQLDCMGISTRGLLVVHAGWCKFDNINTIAYTQYAYVSTTRYPVTGVTYGCTSNIWERIQSDQGVEGATAAMWLTGAQDSIFDTCRNVFIGLDLIYQPNGKGIILEYADNNQFLEGQIFATGAPAGTAVFCIRPKNTSFPSENMFYNTAIIGGVGGQTGIPNDYSAGGMGFIPYPRADGEPLPTIPNTWGMTYNGKQFVAGVMMSNFFNVFSTTQIVDVPYTVTSTRTVILRQQLLSPQNSSIMLWATISFKSTGTLQIYIYIGGQLSANYTEEANSTGRVTIPLNVFFGNGTKNVEVLVSQPSSETEPVIIYNANLIGFNYD